MLFLTYLSSCALGCYFFSQFFIVRQEIVAFLSYHLYRPISINTTASILHQKQRQDDVSEVPIRYAPYTHWQCPRQTRILHVDLRTTRSKGVGKPYAHPFDSMPVFIPHLVNQSTDSMTRNRQ